MVGALGAAVLPWARAAWGSKPAAFTDCIGGGVQGKKNPLGSTGRGLLAVTNGPDTLTLDALNGQTAAIFPEQLASKLQPCDLFSFFFFLYIEKAGWLSVAAGHATRYFWT